MDENTPPGVNIGEPIAAIDADEDGKEFGDMLTYSLEGDGEASFGIDPSTGQLITKAPLNYEDATNQSYSVTVRVKDSRGGEATQAVTIRVNDDEEPPAAPFPPTVVSGEDDADNESTTELKVIWHAPENTGTRDRPPMTCSIKRSPLASFSLMATGRHNPQFGTNTIATIDESGS